MDVNAPGFAVRLTLALVLEVACGIIYNRWVDKHQAENEGVYTAFYMVGGVLITLIIGVLVIGITATVLLLVLFAASGAPMVLGSMQRHTERIKTTNETAIKEARGLLHGTQDQE